MSVEITTPSALKYAKVLIFAPPGHGKTTFLGTAQDDDRTYPSLLLDWEAGTESLDGLDIDVAPLGSWDDAYEVLEMLESGDHDYKSVSVDSISEWLIWAQLERLRIKGPSRNDPDLLEWQDYGTTGIQLKRILRRIRDLNMHIFFSAHAKTTDDAREKNITVPHLSGALANDVLGLVSVAGYLAKVGDEDDEGRTLLLHGHRKYRTKVRTPWLKTAPSEIDDPDVTELLDVLGYTNDRRPASKTKSRK